MRVNVRGTFAEELFSHGLLCRVLPTVSNEISVARDSQVLPHPHITRLASSHPHVSMQYRCNGQVDFVIYSPPLPEEGLIDEPVARGEEPLECRHLSLPSIASWLTR